jgi:hypothetical protein
MGLFDKFKKKGLGDLDDQIAEMQAKNAALAKNADAETQKAAQVAEKMTASLAVNRKGCRVRQLAETENFMCSCGCGEKAEYLFEVGDISFPISNHCGNTLAMKHLGVGQVIGDDIIETEVGSFTGTATINGNKAPFNMRFGLASDDSHNVVFYNEPTEKGVVFTWENLQFLSILLGILDY